MTKRTRKPKAIVPEVVEPEQLELPLPAPPISVNVNIEYVKFSKDITILLPPTVAFMSETLIAAIQAELDKKAGLR